MSTPAKPNDEKSYPWGNKSKTHNFLVFFVAFNIIALSVMFLTIIEIPFIQGEKGLNIEPLGPTEFYINCFIISVLNIAIVITLFRVAYWLKSTIIVQAKGGLWYVRTIYLWVTYTIAVISTIITFYLIWSCFILSRF